MLNTSFLLSLAAHRLGVGSTISSYGQQESSPDGPAAPASDRSVDIPATTDTVIVVPMEQLAFASTENAYLSAPPAASQLAADDADWSSSNSSSAGRDCRICLSTASGTEELIQPCDCCGTLGYIHESCLTAWVTEKGSLICELCGQRYKAPYADKLAPLSTAAMQRRKQTLLTTTGVTMTITPSRLSWGDYICLL
jgi:hypothetical protein